jgi:hypothetical protein
MELAGMGCGQIRKGARQYVQVIYRGCMDGRGKELVWQSWRRCELDFAVGATRGRGDKILT